MTGLEARDDEREARAIFEALADRLGEHPQARNHEIADSGEYETFMHEVQVEMLAEWLMPTVLEVVARRHPEPEKVTDDRVNAAIKALWDGGFEFQVSVGGMRAALESALRVPVGEGEQ